MRVDLTRRTLLRLAGVSTLTMAMAGAVRAEGGAAPGPLPFAARTPVRCGEAALRVRDLDRMIAFYRQAIGLQLIHRGADDAVMGAGGVPLLHLVARPDAPFERPNAAGLFHIAFLMPSRADLARWLVHAAMLRVPLSGFANHSVSEAIYLDDPEGNGLEIYADRSPQLWQWTDGVVTMGTHPLDVDNILALTTTERDTYTGAPDLLRIGHMHLRVGDIPAGRAFYQQALGLASTRGDNPRAAFLSSGGYHHHVAINTWNSAGAGPRAAATTGLDWFSLQVADPAVLQGQVARLKGSGQAVTEIASGIEVADPWGTSLRLVGA